ncbi:MAG: hypothetical protein SFW67_37260 [Myxococcaceae bacterium]|nr:hypothetical protein [Myxococcaceae bacterium]
MSVSASSHPGAPSSRPAWVLWLIASTLLAAPSAYELSLAVASVGLLSSEPLNGRDGALSAGFLLFQVGIAAALTILLLVVTGLLLRATSQWRHWAAWLAAVLLPLLSAAAGVAAARL